MAAGCAHRASFQARHERKQPGFSQYPLADHVARKMAIPGVEQLQFRKNFRNPKRSAIFRTPRGVLITTSAGITDSRQTAFGSVGDKNRGSEAPTFLPVIVQR